MTDPERAGLKSAIEAMRNDPFIDDAKLLGTTQQDQRLAHYAETAIRAYLAALGSQPVPVAVTDAMVHAYKCAFGEYMDKFALGHITPPTPDVGFHAAHYALGVALAPAQAMPGDMTETIALIRKRMNSGECDLRDVGRILTGRWDQDVPAAILAAAAAVEDLSARLEAAARANSTRPDYNLTCEECGRAHILDTVIPSEIWNQIAEPHSLLCTLCIDRRMLAKGLKAECEFYFAGGAMESKLYPAAAATPVPVAVKGLEWEGNYAKTPFGAYTVCENTEERWEFTFHSYPYGVADDTTFDKEGEAKAAAQADYEARIRGAIAPVQDALRVDAEKLSAMTGEEHTVKFFDIWKPIAEYDREKCPLAAVLDWFTYRTDETKTNHPARYVASLNGETNTWFDDDGMELDIDPTHFMPLPTPPKPSNTR
ncbi:MAG: hypothetical protein EOR99_35075 [Mesorhizobium sp.]|nr:MAG: hypothetical protein EOR99_35075 [Mesorhizobium sp.]